MKLTVQLYIGSSQVELFDDETISVTSSIQNVKDIGKVFTDFSQSFSVPASRNNNKIFKHFYNFDVDNGFDARVKASAELQINHMPFRKGKIRLDGVQMKNNVAYAYNLVFYGNTVTLKDLLGEDLLSDIDFSAYNQNFTPTSVTNLLQTGATVNSITDAIITPMISAEQRWYYDSSDTTSTDVGNLYPTGGLDRGAYWKDFKYAIRLYAIIKEIENTYGITFSTDFFDSSQTDFYNLYMWLHREKGKFPTGVKSEYINKLPIEGFSTYGFATVTDYITITDGAFYDISLNLYVTGADYVNVVWYRDGGGGYVEYDRTNNLQVALSPFLINLTGVSDGNYKIAIETEQDQTITSTSYLNVIRGVDSKVFNFVGDQTIVYSFDFVVSDNIPEIKVIDFLTGLFKMFNLTAYEENGVIVVKPLDTYYSAGDSHDLSSYVDVSESNINPTKIYKSLNFKYEGLDSIVTQNHFEQFNLEWGTEQYSLSNKYEGDTYDVIVPFEHMKFERIVDASNGDNTSAQWGWMVDELADNNIDGRGYLGKPLIFYAKKQTSATQIRIQGFPNNTFDLNQYYIPSNSVALTGSQNINFKAELNEYTNTQFNSTLFNTYYSTYISGVFSQKSRLTKITAYLPLKILSKYTLADTFIINQKSYRINSISTDLATGKSQIELLNIV